MTFARQKVVVLGIIATVILAGFGLYLGKQKGRNLKQGARNTSSTSVVSWDFNNFCNNIKIEKIDSILNLKHTKVEHGKTNIEGKLANYYCKIYYPKGQSVFIAYELGNFEKHLESFTTLEIPYNTVDGFKHKAVIVQSGTKEGLIKVNDSAYITVDYIHPVAEAKTKEILKMFDR